MTVQHVNTFRAVIANGSMTRAAQELNTSQPHVSRLINQLEEITEFPLFTRNGTRLQITGDGAKFYEEIKKLFVGLSSLEAAASQIRSFRSEHLRVAAMPRVAAGPVTRIVSSIKKDYPELAVSIHSGTATAVTDWVQTGRCDVGLALLYDDYLRAPRTRPILTMPCVGILPSPHPLTNSPHLRPSDFHGQDFVAFPLGSAPRTQLDGYFLPGSVRPDITVETDLGASVCAFVSQGLGISILNAMAAREEASLAGLEVRPLYPPLSVKLAVISAEARSDNRLVQMFEDYATKEVSKPQYNFSCYESGDEL